MFPGLAIVPGPDLRRHRAENGRIRRICSAMGGRRGLMMLTSVHHGDASICHLDVTIPHPSSYRWWIWWWWVHDLAMYALDQFRHFVVFDVDEEVRVRRTGVGLEGLFVRAAENLVAVRDDCNIAVIVFAPDFLLEIVDVDPVVACALGSMMEEDCLQTIRVLPHVGEV